MLSHIDSKNQPAMVDVGAKEVTERRAHAVAAVTLPASVAVLFREGDITSKKGPVFHTAVLAGIMGAKRTSELIPLCHPLALDDCKVEVLAGTPAADGSLVLEVHCRVRTHGRTGVEMEALTGASVASLTLYDMCKAVSHDIVIGPVRLMAKSGGKSDYLA
jgi:cyclic pyranopterin phosphate synthase